MDNSTSTPGTPGAEGSAGDRVDQAALKYLHLTVVSLDPTGTGRRRWSNRWKKALNAFDITFDGRLSAAR